MSGLILENVEKRFGATYAVQGVNLHLPEGKLVCFLGPVRLRQDHLAAADCRPGNPERRLYPA